MDAMDSLAVGNAHFKPQRRNASGLLLLLLPARAATTGENSPFSPRVAKKQRIELIRLPGRTRNMLQSTSMIIPPLRRRLTGGVSESARSVREVRTVLLPRQRLFSPPHHRSRSSAPFSSVPSSSSRISEDDSTPRAGSLQYMLPPSLSRSGSVYTNRALAFAAQDVCSSESASSFLPSISWKIQQVRHLTSGPGGPSRSSTSAARPSFDEEDANNKGEESNDAGRSRSRLNSARQKGQAAAKKGAIGVRDMIQKYGFTFLGTYFSVYFGTLGALFAGIDSGLMDPATLMDSVSWIPGIHIGGGGEDGEGTKTTVDIVVQLMQKYEFTKPYADAVAENPHTANLGVAWIATKFTEPIRLGVSIAIVPRIHKALGRDVPKDEDDDCETKGGERSKE